MHDAQSSAQWYTNPTASTPRCTTVELICTVESAVAPPQKSGGAPRGSASLNTAPQITGSMVVNCSSVTVRRMQRLAAQPALIAAPAPAAASAPAPAAGGGYLYYVNQNVRGELSLLLLLLRLVEADASRAAA